MAGPEPHCFWLDAGATPNMANCAGYHPAHTGGVTMKKVQMIQPLISQGSRCHAAEQGRRDRVCLPQSRAARFEIVKQLIRAGSDVDAAAWALYSGKNGQEDQSSRDNITPLIAAAECNHTEIARLLLAHGAGIRFRSVKGRTALRRAVLRGNKPLAETLLVAGADPMNGQRGALFWVLPPLSETGDVRFAGAPRRRPEKLCRCVSVARGKIR
jgi:hypothetical protein